MIFLSEKHPFTCPVFTFYSLLFVITTNQARNVLFNHFISDANNVVLGSNGFCIIMNILLKMKITLKFNCLSIYIIVQLLIFFLHKRKATPFQIILKSVFFVEGKYVSLLPISNDHLCVHGEMVQKCYRKL